MLSSLKARTIQGAQGKLATFEDGAGEGLPVLFLHADSGRSRQWEEVLRRIATERRAVALDFRGHGASEPAANGDYGYAGRAEDIGSVADALGLKRFVIVAHSGGAAVALRHAAGHADRVAGLFLLDPPADPRAQPKAVRDGIVKDLTGPRSLEAQKTFYASIAGSDPAVRDRVLADCEVVDPAARVGVGVALAEWNPEPTLKAWRGPIMAVVSTAGDTPHALHALRPDVPHQVIAGTGHWIQLEQPDAVEHAIRRFLTGLEKEHH